MEAVISNFRRGRHVQNTSQMIIKIESVDSKEKAEKLVGKNVVWKTPSNKKEIKGKISAAHGNGGAVRAKFEKGMPGQAIGTKINIL